MFLTSKQYYELCDQAIGLFLYLNSLTRER